MSPTDEWCTTMCEHGAMMVETQKWRGAAATDPQRQWLPFQDGKCSGHFGNEGGWAGAQHGLLCWSRIEFQAAPLNWAQAP